MEQNFNDAHEIEYNVDVNQLAMALKMLTETADWVGAREDNGWSTDMREALQESLLNEAKEVNDELKKAWQEISGEIADT